ncbi:Na+/H+ antiporter NhaA [Metaclostridioides mangenotii]|uniref:Na+/H+ antiporter NhaA n=1 Tax=Metaclostridioides mangenotii TaxID=1540 RepID=UPI0026EE8D5B|nr:Na+/H+ antiporter NhaA [Clostridioides mangenotii]
MGFIKTYKKKNFQIELITSIMLIFATISAIIICNSPFSKIYHTIFNDVYIVNDFSLHMFINDFLMSIFFLVAGLEIKREVLHGNLSTLKKASFPIIAAIGGVVLPAIIYFIFNRNTSYLSGICIPVSTDIAFAVGVFYIFKNKLDPKLSVFLLSLAVVDDLISIICIGVIYSLNIKLPFLIIALIIFFLLIMVNKIFNVQSILYYLIAGLCLWYFIHLSGIHSTISGVLLAISIPSSGHSKISTLDRLLKILTPINNLFIVPLFAFANTGIVLVYNIDISSSYPLILGIIIGLCVGKPLGIILFTYIGSLLQITEKPKNTSWVSLFIVSLLAGIGFTMSIFVTEIAFIHDLVLVDIAKLSILVASIISVMSTAVCIYLYSIYLKVFRIQ